MACTWCTELSDSGRPFGPAFTEQLAVEPIEIEGLEVLVHQRVHPVVDPLARRQPSRLQERAVLVRGKHRGKCRVRLRFGAERLLGLAPAAALAPEHMGHPRRSAGGVHPLVDAAAGATAHATMAAAIVAGFRSGKGPEQAHRL